jgi:predicted O-linked N-acetylglucosamine transferase (SPINDLY family)
MTSALEDALRRYQAGDYPGVIADYGVLAQEPDCPQALLVILAQCHLRTGSPLRAARHFRRAAETEGRDHAAFMLIAGHLFLENLAVNEAFQAGLSARDLAPQDPRTHRFYYRALRHTCLFREIAEENDALLARLRGGDPFWRSAEDPYTHIDWADDEALAAQLRLFPQDLPQQQELLPTSVLTKLRIGYLLPSLAPESSPMRLIEPILARHDADQIDFTLITFETEPVPETHYPTLTIGGINDDSASSAIRNLGLDILVDLAGHAPNGRQNLLAGGLASLKVGFLGVTGPSAGLNYDYIIADATVVPPEAKRRYREKLCRLPGVFTPLPPLTGQIETRSRASLDLPEDAVVFAFFHEKRRLSPACFASLAAILKAEQRAVLWLQFANRFSRDNLLAAMVEAGVPGDRVRFSTPAASRTERMARLAAADVALDSFPHNGPAMIAEALQLGLPVVSMRTDAFWGRMTESLLDTLGLDELIASDDAAYIDLAVALAGDAERRRALSQNIRGKVGNSPVFDSASFALNLESAYGQMMMRARAGLPPEDVDPPPPVTRTN